MLFGAVLLVAGPCFAAPKPRAAEVCLADFHKLCPGEELGRGVVIRCARAHLEAVAPDCKTAVEAANALNAARRAAKQARKSPTKSEAASQAAS
jgi:hypothetical protein